jgi:hypothetical protein
MFSRVKMESIAAAALLAGVAAARALSERAIAQARLKQLIVLSSPATTTAKGEEEAAEKEGEKVTEKRGAKAARKRAARAARAEEKEKRDPEDLLIEAVSDPDVRISDTNFGLAHGIRVLFAAWETTAEPADGAAGKGNSDIGAVGGPNQPVLRVVFERDAKEFLRLEPPADRNAETGNELTIECAVRVSGQHDAVVCVVKGVEAAKLAYSCQLGIVQWVEALFSGEMGGVGAQNQQLLVSTPAWDALVRLRSHFITKRMLTRMANMVTVFFGRRKSSSVPDMAEAVLRLHQSEYLLSPERSGGEAAWPTQELLRASSDASLESEMLRAAHISPRLRSGEWNWGTAEFRDFAETFRERVAAARASVAASSRPLDPDPALVDQWLLSLRLKNLSR